MTTPFLPDDLRAEEGLRLAAYPDPLTGGAPWTIGYGHTGPDVFPGLRWTEAEAEQTLAADVAKACRALDQQLPWWRRLDDVRQDVLADMTFNMGVAKLCTFVRALRLVHDGCWAAAADAMLDSAWSLQVGGRARRLAEQMRTGARPV